MPLGKKARAIINKEISEKTGSLDLGHLKMNFIPEELASMTWLTWLNLADNRLKEINGLSTLVNLQYLDLSHNSFYEIKGLDTLKALKELLISKSDLWDCDGLDSLINLKVLIMKDNAISNINGILHLTKLETVDFMGNELKKLPDLSNLKSLAYLDLSNNALSSVKGISGMQELSYLLLDNNLIRNLEDLGNLEKLHTLSVSKNDIKKLSFSSPLTGLKTLNVAGNQINSISGTDNIASLLSFDLSHNNMDEIGTLSQLKHLQFLNLSFNVLRIINGLENCKVLSELLLNDNKIVEIRGLSNLSSILKLNLSNNYIDEIRGLKGIRSLSELNLSKNKIQAITGLSNLHELKKLHLSENQISVLEGLDGLTKLENLILYNNKIELIQGLESFENIKLIDLNHNKINVLRPFLPLFKKFPELEIHYNHNPLKSPPAVIAGNKESIIDFYESLESERSVPIDQIKLIFLGNSSSGKTSLSKFLSKREYDLEQETTHGIITLDWQISLPGKPNFQVNIWDFGGQQYYHATHRIFLSHNSVYVVTCNADLEQNDLVLTDIFTKNNGETVKQTMLLEHFKYPYWLETINYYTKGYQSAVTVSMVENKSNSRPGNTPPLKLTNQEHYLFKILEFVQLDVKEAFNYTQKHFERYYYSNFENWVHDIKQVIAKTTDGEIPGNYPIIREVLKFMANDENDRSLPSHLALMLYDANITAPAMIAYSPPWISVAHYQSIVKTYTKRSKPGFENCINYLQQFCGSILYFPNIPSLIDEICINPNWLHDIIYKVLSPEVHLANGWFELAHVEKIIENEPMDTLKLLDIMKSFNLVFELPEGGFIAPQYLPAELSQGKQKELEKTLRDSKFERKISIIYPDYLPPSLICQFIAIKGSQSRKEIYWRNGILYKEYLGDDFVHVFISCDFSTGEISIDTPRLEKNYLVNKILKDLLKIIISDLSQDQTDIQIRLPEAAPATWDLLCKAKMGHHFSIVGKYGQPIVAADYFPFLPDYDNYKVNIFISYSHAQSKAFEIFRTHIRNWLVFPGIEINVIDDLDISAGTRWHEFITTEVQKCDIFIALLSQSYMNSPYIQENEIKPILERKANGSFINILPIKFSHFNSETNKEIMNLQIFNPKGNYGQEHNTVVTFSDLITESLQEKFIGECAKKLSPIIKKIWNIKTGHN